MGEENSGNKKERPLFRGIYVMLGILLAAVTASIVLSVVTLKVSLEQKAASESEEITGTQENDVEIAGHYEIKSTENISDAYKSGDRSGLNDKEKEILDMASKILDGIIQTDMSAFDKEKAVYDWMTHNLENDNGVLTVIPETQADADNPYGVLKYHNAVCVGYATTFRLFMQMMDIPCMVIHNTEAYHSWDLVQLDGDWYHTDIYMDAEMGNYTNFNMNDSMSQSNNHDWDTEFFPAATSLAYNESYRNAQDADDIYDIPKLLRKAIDKGESMVALKFGPDLTEEKAQIAVNMLDQLTTRMQNSVEYQNIYVTHSWNSLDSGYLLAMSIIDYTEEDGSGSDISEEDQKKMDDAIEDAFGDVEELSSEDYGDYTEESSDGMSGGMSDGQYGNVVTEPNKSNGKSGNVEMPTEAPIFGGGIQWRN